MSDHEKRVIAAIEKHAQKDLDATKRDKTKRKNAAPEAAVGKTVDKWAKDTGWFFHKYESKAKHVQLAGGVSIHKSAGVNVGTPDRLGCSENGIFVAVELKAPGKRSTVTPEQREFLTGVIMNHGFGVVVDSAELLDEYWTRWCVFNKCNGVGYLLECLPQKKASDKDETPAWDNDDAWL